MTNKLMVVDLSIGPNSSGFIRGEACDELEC